MKHRPSVVVSSTPREQLQHSKVDERVVSNNYKQRHAQAYMDHPP